MPRIFFSCLSLFLMGASLNGLAGDEAKPAAGLRVDELRAQIRAAHTAGDAAAYLAKSRELESLLNASPNSILQVMSAQAFGHDEEGALESLREFVAMGQSAAGAMENEVFTDLKKSERFKALAEEMRKNEGAIGHSAVVFEMPETGLIPEDIAYDPVRRRFYVSSVLKGEILRIDPNGRAAVFARSARGRPMMALKIDVRRRRLWATEVALNGFISIPKEDWKSSVLLLYDLDSGHLIQRMAGPAQATLGDMALTPDGDAIVSDNDGGIYRAHRKTLRLERLDSGEFISPQTPAISSDGRMAYIPDYLRGIAIMDLQTRKVRWMNEEGRHALAGIDGLYLSGRSLLATQNGASPERVVRFEMDESLSRVESESVIERATPKLGDPTHGVLVDGDFYYIADSGWDALQDDGTPKAGRTPGKGMVMRVSVVIRREGQSK